MADADDARRLVHDLRSPLAAVDGFAALLQDDPEPEKRAEYLRLIRDAVAEMQTLLDERR